MLIFSLLTIVTLGGLAVSGWFEHNKELAEKQAGQIGFTEYLHSGHFIEATFENWESEFLQLALYVILTIKLRQIGSSESKKLMEKKKLTVSQKLIKTHPGQ